MERERVKEAKIRPGPQEVSRPLLSGILVLFMMCLMPQMAKADSIDHLTLDEIVVVGDAVAGDPLVTDVDRKTIEKGRNFNIPDVLKNEPDIDLQRRTLVGDTRDSMSIRGFSGNRIMLNINGRPVNAAGVVGGYYIDWGTIPLDNIEKIEIIRGGSSAQYGNNTLGGVVNVITRKPTEKPTVSLFGTFGAGGGLDGLQNYRVNHAYKKGRFGYSLAGSYQKAEPFLWNNEFEGKNFSADLFFDMPFSGELSLGFQYTDMKRGFIMSNRQSENPNDPGFGVKLDGDYPLALGETFSPYSGLAFKPGPGAYWDKTKYYLDFGYSQPIRDALLNFKFYKNFEDRKEKNYSSKYVNAAYGDGQLVLDRTVGSDRSYGGSFDITKPFGRHEILAGAEHKVLAYGDIEVDYIDLVYNSASNLVNSQSPTSEGYAWGAFLQDTWQVTDKFTLTGALRYDWYENKAINESTSPGLKDDAVTPKVIGTYRPTDRDTVTTALYQALRTPGLPETYWWANGATKGDPTLKPEKNNAAEVLYQHKFPDAKASLRLSGYYYDVQDYIMIRFNSSWRGVYNIDRAEFWGASLEARKEFASWLSGKANLTYQKSKKRGDIYDTANLTDEIDYLPEWKASAGLEFKLPYESVFNLSLRYVGERKAIYAYTLRGTAYFELVELDPFVTADLSLRIPVTRFAEASFYVENLFDQDYEEQFGYPMPGILVGTGLKFSF